MSRRTSAQAIILLGLFCLQKVQGRQTKGVRERRILYKEKQEDSVDSTMVAGLVLAGLVLLCIVCCVVYCIREAQQIRRDEEEEEAREEKELAEFEIEMQRYIEDNCLEQVKKTQMKEQGLEMTAMNNPNNSQAVLDFYDADQFGTKNMDSCQQMTASKSLTSSNAKGDPSKQRDIENDFDELGDEVKAAQNLEKTFAPGDSIDGLQNEVQDFDDEKPRRNEQTGPAKRIPYSGPPYTEQELRECRDPILVGERGDFDPFEGMGPEEKAAAMIVRQQQIEELMRQLDEIETSDSDSDDYKKKKKKKNKQKSKKKAKLHVKGMED